jgi:anthranilate phosphoribosyltransferase
MLKDLTSRCLTGHSLSPSEAESALDALLNPSTGDSERLAFLGALADKGESVDEIIGFAQGMMKRCVPVALPHPGVDLCGTGGSGLDRFNVSTTVAFVLASLNVPVCKHGNRGSQKGNGSFDLLEALGLPIDLNAEEQVQRFKDHGLCFLFARAHHPTVKAVGPARAQLGRRTIFNLVGPLCNPSKTERQVLGVSDPKLGPLMIEALKALGRKSAMVVWGEPGIDEISLSGNSQLWQLENGSVSHKTLNPNDLDLPTLPWDSLPSGEAEHNAQLFQEIINGGEAGGLRQVVAINAASALVVTETHPNLKAGYQAALEALSDGRTLAKFNDLLPS